MKEKSKFSILMNALFKQGIGWGSEGDSKTKKSSNKVIISFLLLVILPVLFSLGFISYFLTWVYNTTEIQRNVLTLGMCLSGITMLFFGVLMVPGIFYYSDDIEPYMSLPIKEQDVVNAKLITTWVWENITCIFIFIPILLGSFIALSPNSIQYWSVGLIVAITLSIVPMLYGIIVIVLLVRFTAFGQNKKILSYLLSCFSIFLTTLLAVSMIDYMLSDISFTLFDRMVSSDNSFVSFINIIFPHFKYGADAIINGNIVSMLIYLGFNIFVYGIYLIIIKLFYRDGLIKVQSGNRARLNKNKNKGFKNYYGNNKYGALLKREWNNLFHNPTFFSSCISTTLIFPVFFFLLKGTSIFENFKNYYETSNILNNMSLILFVLVLLFMVPAGMNFIAATSVSREGSDYTFIKYAPVKLDDIIEAKYNFSLHIGFITYIVSLLIIIFYLGISISLKDILIGSILGAMVTRFLCGLGVFLDCYNPTLLWKEPNKAVKENFNGVVLLVVTINIAILLYFTFLKWHWLIGVGIIAALEFSTNILLRKAEKFLTKSLENI